MCSKESEKYITLKEFSTNNRSAYNSALKNGFLYEITSHMQMKKHKGYWTKENCYKESMKYKNKISFQEGSRGAYKRSYENNWLCEFF